MAAFTIVPTGPFSLAESIGFGFGQRAASAGDVLRLAFCRDAYDGHAGVVVRQDADGTVHGEVHGEVLGGGDVAAVQAQVARMLSLDVDATGFVAVGDRDPVVASLLAAAPGLRPPLFHSPYEAAAWAAISLRISGAQARTIRDRLAAAVGTTYDLAGEAVAAFPTPDQVLAAEDLPGVPPAKADRLRGVARAALDGVLDADRLRALDPDEARRQLRTVPGLGPFFASLVLVRATGVTDVLPDEPRMRALAGELYGLGPDPALDRVAAVAEAWRPFRTWVAVLLRAAGPRVTG